MPDVAVLVAASTAADVDLGAAGGVTVVSGAVLRLGGLRRGGGPASHPSPVLVQRPALTAPAASAG